MDEVKKVIIGKDGCVEKVMAAILAKGNVLLEDVPGVGKTEMAGIFQGYGAFVQPGTVYAGCDAGGHHGFFHVSEGRRTVCIPSRRGYVQPAFG